MRVTNGSKSRPRLLLVSVLAVLMPIALFVGIGIGIGRPAMSPAPTGLPSPPTYIITSTPVRIDRPGRYVLTSDLEFASPNEAAIQIAASQVTIDLQGFSIRCTSDSADRTSIGIQTDQQSGIVVRDGTLDGFYAGVRLRDVFADGRYAPRFGQHRIERLIIRNSTFRGIRVEGRACMIADNQIIDTGGSTAHPDAFAMGIEVIGPAMTVRGNTVVNTFAVGAGEAVAISVSAVGMGSIVESNNVYNDRQHTGRSIGVWIGGESTAAISCNQVTNFEWGIAGSSTTAWAFQDNHLVSCEMPLVIAGYPANQRVDDVRWDDGGGNTTIRLLRDPPDPATP